MEDGAERTLGAARDISAQGLDAAPTYDLIIPAAADTPDPLPVYVGHVADHPARWLQMMLWLPGFVSAIGGELYRVNCTKEADPYQGVIDCHVLVARAALDFYQGSPGTYIDLEDNCHPTQRADYRLVGPARAQLSANPKWSFLMLSRFPVPVGLVNPETCVDTPLYEYGANVYRKLLGTVELSQAMLCHTDFAARIASPTHVFTAPYDAELASEMLYVLYPSMIQRHTDAETISNFFSGGLWAVLTNIGFTPFVYTTVDFVNAHGAWISILLLPIVTIACLTGDLVIAAWCFLSGFCICWALGFR